MLWFLFNWISIFSLPVFNHLSTMLCRTIASLYVVVGIFLVTFCCCIFFWVLLAAKLLWELCPAGLCKNWSHPEITLYYYYGCGVKWISIYLYFDSSPFYCVIVLLLLLERKQFFNICCIFFGMFWQIHKRCCMKIEDGMKCWMLT